MGLTPDSFQSIRFAAPQRLLGADRLMTLAAEVGAAGAHGGMPDISFEWPAGEPDEGCLDIIWRSRKSAA